MSRADQEKIGVFERSGFEDIGYHLFDNFIFDAMYDVLEGVIVESLLKWEFL